MFYLVLSVLSTAVVSLAMRLSERYRNNHISMLAVNYVICIVLAGCFSGWSSILPDLEEGAGFCLSLGILQGVLYLASFLLLQLNISKNGVVMSTTFMRLGLLVPTICSVVIFGELPEWLQVVGFLAAICAILMISLEKGSGKASFKLGLICILLCAGVTDFLAKVYEEFGNAALRDTYLLYAFIASGLICIGLAILKKQRLTLMDVLFGILIGIPNFFSARFMLYALKSLPAIVVYPTHSVSTIILVCVGGVLFFREKLSRRQIGAILLIMTAVALLNI
ncbi:MAG: DMT family transporter [Oscillospiraceae bacterium]|nr:DMT family transporter [Oscillospiraceae bacterium]